MQEVEEREQILSIGTLLTWHLCLFYKLQLCGRWGLRRRGRDGGRAPADYEGFDGEDNESENKICEYGWAVDSRSVFCLDGLLKWHNIVSVHQCSVRVTIESSPKVREAGLSYHRTYIKYNILFQIPSVLRSVLILLFVVPPPAARWYVQYIGRFSQGTI